MDMPLDPRIGMLSGGRFYCFANGYDRPEIVGTLETVQVALGLRAKPAKAAAVRRYQVTVTPQMTIYCGAWCGEAYTVEVDAVSHSRAIAMVRQQRNEEEGRYGVRATYRAKVLERD